MFRDVVSWILLVIYDIALAGFLCLLTKSIRLYRLFSFKGSGGMQETQCKLLAWILAAVSVIGVIVCCIAIKIL